MNGLMSKLIHPSRARLLAALALVLALVAGAPAYAADDPGKKDQTAEPPAATDQLPDRARGKTPTAAESKALSVLQRRISEYVAKNGTKYSFSSRFDAEEGRLIVDTDAPSELMQELTRMSDDEQQKAIDEAELRRSTASDVWHRRDDIQPFWGGAGITWGGGTCSSGYAIRTAAGVFSTTAGHCFPNGANVLVESGLRSYGTVSGRRLPTVTGHPTDIELLGGRIYAGRIYSGGVFSMTSHRVVAAGTAYEGYTNYCHSGRTTGEHCGHTARSINAQVCTQSGCKSPVIEFTGGTMINNGDSGGPFYALDWRGDAWIRGNVIATDGVRGWATPYTVVAATYGASIVTG